MPYVDHARKELRLKIVYYGPGLGGKTTNIEHIHRRTRKEHRGKLLALTGPSERTLFFDLLPMNIGWYKDYALRVHLCSVPGQIAQERVRQLVLRNVDGVVFVVDCQPQRVADNQQSMRDLDHNLRLLGIESACLPAVVQLNKRDLVGPRGIAEARTALRLPPEVVQVVASAARGEGVFETLKAILKECLATVDLDLPRDSPASAGRGPGAHEDEHTAELRARLHPSRPESPPELT